MRELGVELILAHSPQAKGRVERRHGVFQDRFVKTLRLQQINTLESANSYLESQYLDELNELLDGTIRLTSGARSLSWKEVSARPPKVTPKPKPPASNNAPYKPAANHPWRRR